MLDLQVPEQVQEEEFAGLSFVQQETRRPLSEYSSGYEGGIGVSAGGNLDVGRSDWETEVLLDSSGDSSSDSEPVIHRGQQWEDWNEQRAKTITDLYCDSPPLE